MACELCPFSVVDITVLDAESFYEDHVEPSVPLLIRDPILKTLKTRWSDTYLASVAETHVHDEVRLASDLNFPLTKVQGERSRSMTVGEFLDIYRNKSRLVNMYATNLVLPRLKHDFQRPRFTSLLDHSCASGWCGGLWLGADRQRSALHRDFSENVHAVIEGTKGKFQSPHPTTPHSVPLSRTPSTPPHHPAPQRHLTSPQQIKPKTHQAATHPMPACPIPFEPIQSDPIPPHAMPCHAVPSHLIPSHHVTTHPITSHHVPSHPTPPHSTLGHPSPSQPIPLNACASHPVASYPAFILPTPFARCPLTSLLLTTYYLLLTTYYLLHTTYYLLLTSNH